MKFQLYLPLLIIFFALNARSQTLPAARSLDKTDTWTRKDLIQPAELASILNKPQAKKPIVLNIGVAEDIFTAKKIGAASNAGNLEKLKATLEKLPASSFVVIYCGCCPFEKCPNIRPAFNLMKSMGFTNGRLLNLPVNLHQNWISPGYPMAAGK